MAACIRGRVYGKTCARCGDAVVVTADQPVVCRDCARDETHR